MSEGPIKQWRDAWKPPNVTTSPTNAVHFASLELGRVYCGRRGASFTATADRQRVTCSECLAALRADS